MLVAAVSFVGYCIAGFVQNAWAILAISFILLCAVLFGLKKFFIVDTEA